MFVTSDSTNDIYEYSLSVGFDLSSTVNLVQNVDLGVMTLSHLV